MRGRARSESYVAELCWAANPRSQEPQPGLGDEVALTRSDEVFGAMLDEWLRMRWAHATQVEAEMAGGRAARRVEDRAESRGWRKRVWARPWIYVDMRDGAGAGLGWAGQGTWRRAHGGGQKAEGRGQWALGCSTVEKWFGERWGAQQVWAGERALPLLGAASPQALAQAFRTHAAARACGRRGLTGFTACRFTAAASCSLARSESRTAASTSSPLKEGTQYRPAGMAKVNIHALGLGARSAHGPSSKFPFHERAILGDYWETGHLGTWEPRTTTAFWCLSTLSDDGPGGLRAGGALAIRENSLTQSEERTGHGFDPGSQLASSCQLPPLRSEELPESERGASHIVTLWSQRGAVLSARLGRRCSP
ncbi:hypothetical protein N431DRAFT_451946 [Stipitochalara longipes BDJ]|nr:hypothetical protein N431DRAFT_451946 [Stipitochalara longipes BDJ]